VIAKENHTLLLEVHMVAAPHQTLPQSFDYAVNQIRGVLPPIHETRILLSTVQTHCCPVEREVVWLHMHWVSWLRELAYQSYSILSRRMMTPLGI